LEKEYTCVCSKIDYGVLVHFCAYLFRTRCKTKFYPYITQ